MCILALKKQKTKVNLDGTIMQAQNSMSAESMTDVTILYQITEISFFYTSPPLVIDQCCKCICTLRVLKSCTFVFVVQGHYARIYYLNPISLIPNWGEEKAENAERSVPNWASLSPSNLQRCRRKSFNGEILEICEKGKLRWQCFTFVRCLPHVLLSSPVSSFAFLSTTGLR